jgi:hypothetical protein
VGSTIDDLNYRSLSSLFKFFWASKKTSLHIANDDLLGLHFFAFEHEHGNTIHSFTTWLKMAEKPTVSFVMMHLQGARELASNISNPGIGTETKFSTANGQLSCSRQDGNQDESNFVSASAQAQRTHMIDLSCIPVSFCFG